MCFGLNRITVVSKCRGMHERVSSGEGGNMLRRGESSWLCMKFEFDQDCFFRLLSLHVDCECYRPSFLATVFYAASGFNGNLNQWDVAKVTTMSFSKSIRILENDLS